MRPLCSGPAIRVGFQGQRAAWLQRSLPLPGHAHAAFARRRPQAAAPSTVFSSFSSFVLTSPALKPLRLQLAARAGLVCRLLVIISFIIERYPWASMLCPVARFCPISL